MISSAPDFFANRRKIPAFEVAIIGTGPAGLIASWRLRAKKIRHVVIEKGPLKAVPSLYTDQLRGEISTLKRDYLHTHRTQAFGGTLDKWSGNLMRMSLLDLEEYDAETRAGWNLEASDLKDLYEESEFFLGDQTRNFKFDYFQLSHQLEKYSFYENKKYKLKISDFSAREKDEIAKSEYATLVYGCEVTMLNLSKDKHEVSSLTVHYGSETAELNASGILLAAGTIENIKLVLKSERQPGGKVFNPHSLAGRYLLEHPTYFLAVPQVLEPKLVKPYYFKSVENGYVSQVLSLRSRQGKESVIPALMSVHQNLPDSKFTSEMKDQYFSGKTRFEKFLFSKPYLIKPDTFVTLRLQQRPIFENQISLMTEGEPEPKNALINWNRGSLIQKSYSDLYNESAVFLRAFLKVRPFLLHSDENSYDRAHLASHLMGGLRISKIPADGIVNNHGRHHQIRNFYLAGGSIFPLAPAVNPTLTICALALRATDDMVFRCKK